MKCLKIVAFHQQKRFQQNFFLKTMPETLSLQLMSNEAPQTLQERPFHKPGQGMIIFRAMKIGCDDKIMISLVFQLE